MSGIGFKTKFTLREIVEWKVENMTDLTPELGLDAIDEWFKIGKKSVQHSLKTVPRSVTRGRYFNIETQRPRVAETEDAFHLQRYVSYRYIMRSRILSREKMCTLGFAFFKT